jgi:hypothetical protein
VFRRVTRTGGRTGTAGTALLGIVVSIPILLGLGRFQLAIGDGDRTHLLFWLNAAALAVGGVLCLWPTRWRAFAVGLLVGWAVQIVLFVYLIRNLVFD